MELKTKSKTFRLVFSALMVGLATAMSLVSIGLPFGGSITPGSMIPLVVVSQLYGFGWGTLACTAYGLLQMLLGLDNFSYVTTIWAVIAVVLFDYLAAYGVMSLSAAGRKLKKPSAGAALGAVAGCAARFVCHCISGAVVWGAWADMASIPKFLHGTALTEGRLLAWTYSFFYNLGYMLPETVITAVGSAAVMAALAKTAAKES